MRIDPDRSVNDLVREAPTLLPALTAAGIDTCCGGATSLRDAARAAGADLASLLASLEAALPRAEAGAPAQGDGGCGCRRA